MSLTDDNPATTDSLYGVRNGQVYFPADGTDRRLLVLDCDTYAACGDVVVRDMATNAEFRIDAFKLAMVRYTLVVHAKKGIRIIEHMVPLIIEDEEVIQELDQWLDLATKMVEEWGLVRASPDYLTITREVVTNEPTTT